MEPEYKVKSLAKALDVIECFTECTPELGVVQISNMLGLNKSNTHNILSTFEQKGYIEKNEQTGKYRLGPSLLRFSFIINEHLGYQRVAYDLMRDAARELNAVTYFAIPKNGKVLYLYNAYPPLKNYDFPFRTIVGAEAPFYCTALGKAMLAFMPEEEAEAYINGEKIIFTESTITSVEDLRSEIEEVRKRGYSIDNEEHEYGVVCVGVPVFTMQGNLLGAISVSRSKASFNDKILETSVHVMQEAAFHMRERL